MRHNFASSLGTVDPDEDPSVQTEGSRARVLRTRPFLFLLLASSPGGVPPRLHYSSLLPSDTEAL